jgi:AraC family transcriptional regulator of adaptative response/methylated-DNA-[protein]-cysteine methyltransferase
MADRMRAWIEGQETVRLDEFGRAFGLTKWHALRAFKSATGMTPREYAEARRVGRLRSALQSGGGVADAVYEAGYGSGSRVYEQSERSLGMTPASYAKQGRGARIRFTIALTALGETLVARTERGLCAVRIGDGPDLERELKAEFSMAQIERDDSGLQAEMEVVHRLASGRLAQGMPLDVLGTAFQRKVWAELQSIGRGERRTYSEVARAIGEPAAVRAVANACASNPVAMVVPCHRVVRSDGAMGGYRWGETRKRRLLDAELRGE